ncbi:MAG: hypothetical protein IKH36_02005 [Bacilli bacterium]|nr:hypothetical protein [Bacilli bacterium]
MKETTFSTTIPDYRKLVTNLNYNFAESPSTQQYHSVAARDNPDYAQAIGDIYRWGDVNRANFNLNLDYITDLNNRQYLDAIQKDQRAYAEKLRNEQRTYNERQQAKAWARADAKAKELRDQQLQDMMYGIAIQNMDREAPSLRNLAKYTGYRDVGGIDRNKLEEDRNNLIEAYNNVYNLQNLVGNSKNEILYNALMRERDINNQINEWNNQRIVDTANDDVANLYRDRSNSAYLTATKPLFASDNDAPALWENDNRGYAAKSINEDAFRRLTHGTKGDKAEFLDTFMKNHGARDPGGWNTDEFTIGLRNDLTDAGYDLTNMAPLYGYNENGELTEYVFDDNNATIYEVRTDVNNNNMARLVPVDQLERSNLSKLFSRFK